MKADAPPQDSLPPIVLAVPGRWKDGETLRRCLAAEGGGYLFDGDDIINVATRRSYPCDVAGPDRKLGRNFSLAGQGRVPRADLDAIKKHTRTLYVTGHGGSPAAARDMVRLGTALLNAGGIAVKVECSGIAHGRQGLRI